MQNTKDLLKTESQSPSAYSTLSSKPAKDYLKGIGADPNGVNTVHIILGEPSAEVPENIAKFVPPSAYDRLRYSKNHPEVTLNGTWFMTSTATRFDNENDRPLSQITSDNLANMFTVATTTITERTDNSRGVPWQTDNTKNEVTSGRMYTDMFTSAVNALHLGGIINNDQRNEIFQRKLEAIQASPTSIFNYRFDGSLPIEELKKLTTPPEYVSVLLQLIDQWDNAQTEAVKKISVDSNQKIRIAGLLPSGTPNQVIDAAVATAEGKTNDVNKLVQWSKEIPTDMVFEAATNFSQLDEKLIAKVDNIVKSQRNWKSLKGEKNILGDYNGYTKDGMKLLLAVIKLDSFDIFDASPSERAVLNQKLEAWTAITHPDKRGSIDGLKPLLGTDKGVDVLDRIQSISAYLLSISRQAGKDQK